MYDSLMVTGRNPLDGSVCIQGAKNSSLPILAASFLCKGISRLSHIPDIQDVWITLDILKRLGCPAEFKNGIVTVDTTCPTGNRIDDTLMRKLRSSVFFLGAVLARAGDVHLSYPGGYIA